MDYVLFILLAVFFLGICLYLGPSDVCYLHSHRSWGRGLILTIKEYLEPAGIRNMIYSLLASDPVLGYIKAHHKSSLSQALHIQKAREAFPGTERAGHEAENWPEGKTELLIALPGREACAPSRAMALACGLVN